MVEIIPAILTSSPQELKDMVSGLEGHAQRVQVDIIDGQFADNKTIDPSSLEEIETNLKLDFHLMVKEPINWVERCVNIAVGKRSLRSSDLRIIGQIEQMGSQAEFIGKVQEVGAKAGLAIDIKTKVDSLDPAVLNNLDVVLVMSVPAGFGGQKFDTRALDKIKRLDEIRLSDATPYKICVDGGVNTKVMSQLGKAGADEVSVGRRLFEGKIEENINKYKKAAYK